MKRSDRLPVLGLSDLGSSTSNEEYKHLIYGISVDEGSTAPGRDQIIYSPNRAKACNEDRGDLVLGLLCRLSGINWFSRTD